MTIRLDFLTFDRASNLNVMWWMEIHAQSLKAGEIIGRNIARNMEETTFQKAYNWNPEPA